ncbi:MAG: hypothetical protein A2289_15025 [Deltaproteobacteria bacterium RIFOXYA12_FULL_58_15]|nr:MAG: hypothetical protein A2289_15025 [Deltaproteobacteria bacterium RIFOXYA12_FULL_58_15]
MIREFTTAAKVSVILTAVGCTPFCDTVTPRAQSVLATATSPPPRSVSEGTASRPDGSALEHYVLDEPDLIARLPLELQEVSGLTDISPSEVACVQDEDGVIFVYDLELRKITRRVRFGPTGDYEGVTGVGSRLFVLRSDGVLFEVEVLQGEPSIRTHALGIPTGNNEGLCFDPGGERLLIAPKSRLGKGKEFKNVRPVYALDLKKLTLEAEPSIVLDVERIRNFAEAHARPLPEKEKKKGGGKRISLRFMPSSLAVHPMTGEIVVLSAIDHVLAAFDQRGNVTGYAMLDAKLLPQSEGITFLPSGDMVVVSEGAGKEASLLRFHWNGPPLMNDWP